MSNLNIIFADQNFKSVINYYGLKATFLVECDRLHIWEMDDENFENLRYVVHSENWETVGCEVGYTLVPMNRIADYRSIKAITIKGKVFSGPVDDSPYRLQELDGETPVYDYNNILDYVAEELGFGQFYNVHPILTDIAIHNNMTLKEFLNEYL